MARSQASCAVKPAGWDEDVTLWLLRAATLEVDLRGRIDAPGHDKRKRSPCRWPIHLRAPEALLARVREGKWKGPKP